MNNTGKGFKRVRARRTTSPGIILGDGVINFAACVAHRRRREDGRQVLEIARERGCSDLAGERARAVYIRDAPLRKAKRELLHRNVTLQ